MPSHFSLLLYGLDYTLLKRCVTVHFLFNTLGLLLLGCHGNLWSAIWYPRQLVFNSPSVLNKVQSNTQCIHLHNTWFILYLHVFASVKAICITCEQEWRGWITSMYSPTLTWTCIWPHSQAPLLLIPILYSMWQKTGGSLRMWLLTSVRDVLFSKCCLKPTSFQCQHDTKSQTPLCMLTLIPSKHT